MRYVGSSCLSRGPFGITDNPFPSLSHPESTSLKPNHECLNESTCNNTTSDSVSYFEIMRAVKSLDCGARVTT